MSSDDAAAEALLEFMNRVEAGIASAKQLLSDRKGVSPHPNYDDLPWVQREGTKGPYEQASRQNSKVDTFDRLKTELKDHGGFLQRGDFKYWFDRGSQNIIDRRRIRNHSEG